MPQRLDFAQWEFANVQLAPIKLKLSTGTSTTIISGGLAAETAARIAADNALQSQINGLFVSGTEALGNGIDSGSVGGLGLSFVPSQVLLTVRIPAGGLMIFAASVGAPTAASFDYVLSGITDSANYELDYLLLP